jgi:predicted RND superfamily exporter protein
MVFKDRLITMLVHYPYRIMLISLVLILGVGFGGSRLTVESGIDVFFSQDDPNLIADRELKRTYGREDNVLFVIDTRGGDIFEASTLSSIGSSSAIDPATERPGGRCRLSKKFGSCR